MNYLKQLKAALLFAVLLTLTFTSHAREVININNNWSFSFNTMLVGEYRQVNLPHSWVVENKHGVTPGSFKGSANYLKQIQVPAEWSGKKIFVHFGGVSSVANILVNGKYVGKHEGAYTAFTFDITPYLNLGQYNSILVNVINAPQFDIMPLTADQNQYGGIYRNVDLIVTDPNHISLAEYGSNGVFLNATSVTESDATIKAVVKVDGLSDEDLNVNVSLTDEDGQEYASSDIVSLNTVGNGQATLTINVNSPKLWNGEANPHLYKVKATLSKNNQVIDFIDDYFGIRTLEMIPSQGFLLNGSPLVLRGVNIYQDRAGVGNALTDTQIEEDVDLVEEMGANAVRNNGAPFSPKFYSYLDERGVIAWVDLPFNGDLVYMGKGYIDSYTFKENGKQQLLEMIYQLYNHPSICFWGIFNELISTGDDPKDYISSLVQLAKSVSPDRITVASSIEDGPINKLTDAIGFPQYFGWERGTVQDFGLWSKQIKNNYSNLAVAVSEYGIPGDIYTSTQKDITAKDQPKTTGNPQSEQAKYHEEYYKIINGDKSFWGTFVNSMFDYGNIDRRGGLVDGINTMGLVSFDRHYKKDAFYLYKALWNDYDKFVHIGDKGNKYRSGLKQSIKVYSNADQVRLILNGNQMDPKDVVNGIATWDDLEFLPGKNRVIVNADGITDIAEFEVSPTVLAW